MHKQLHIEIDAKGSVYDLRSQSSGEVCVYRDEKYNRICEIRSFIESLAGKKFILYITDGQEIKNKIQVYDNRTLEEVISLVKNFTVEQTQFLRSKRENDMIFYS
jgi:hypothetical protein